MPASARGGSAGRARRLARADAADHMTSPTAVIFLITASRRGWRPAIVQHADDAVVFANGANDRDDARQFGVPVRAAGDTAVAGRTTRRVVDGARRLVPPKLRLPTATADTTIGTPSSLVYG